MFGGPAYMPGQFALLPGAGAVGAVLDEPELDCVVEPELDELDELSVWAQATDAPAPTIVTASAAPASACFIRSDMSFTSLRLFVTPPSTMHLRRSCAGAQSPVWIWSARQTEVHVIQNRNWRAPAGRNRPVGAHQSVGSGS
jgi:hypothetical protein